MADVANSRRPTTIWNRVKSSPRLWDSSHTAADIALQAPCRNTWINGIYRSAVQALKLMGWDIHNPSAKTGGRFLVSGLGFEWPGQKVTSTR